MKNRYFVLFIFFAFTTATNIYTHNITAIFFDIESIFQTDKMKASGYIGKINSLRYLSQVGNLPCQEDLFKHLKGVKAQSKQITYNNSLEMPLIFSDWLLHLQSSTKIKETITRYFTNKNVSDIEVKVLLAIVNMMLNAQSLADTQTVRSKMEHTLQKLKQKGYKLFLVGNWSSIGAMKTAFPEIFKYFSATFMSGDLHLMKPYQEYYEQALQLAGVEKHQALWIETEQKFKTKAQQYGQNVVGFFENNYHTLVNGLKSFAITL